MMLITQLYMALQSLFLPAIEIVEDKIVLRTREKYLAVIKNIDEITDINFTEDNELIFSFQDNSYTIYAEDILTEDIELLKSQLSF